jgi:hypothetical protein
MVTTFETPLWSIWLSWLQEEALMRNKDEAFADEYAKQVCVT